MKLHLRKSFDVFLKKNTVKGSVVFFFSFLVITVSNAQYQISNKNEQYEITGTVCENNNEKLEFATVFIPEYAMGTVTDENGHFVLKAVP
ncbi:MAG: carboxypeptidase-like regulatory domain-containing protein, partial [Tannerellaceae bacterium]|nr:carboxypeptidase-like regulatory domain-containing protein [Tannerellaceae bacterium]